MRVTAKRHINIEGEQITGQDMKSARRKLHIRYTHRARIIHTYFIYSFKYYPKHSPSHHSTLANILIFSYNITFLSTLF